MADTAPFSLRLLGDFCVQGPDGVPVAALPRRAPALLMWLALSNNGGRTRDSTAAMLWCDVAAERARQRLRQLLSDLRHQGLPLQSDADRLHLEAKLWRVDVLRCEQLAARADGASLEQALLLYVGSLAAVATGADDDSFEVWRGSEQNRLHRLALSTCERLVQALPGPEQASRRVPVLQRWIALEPAAEAAHRALMQAWLQLDRCDDALDQFERCRDALHAAHGTRPQSETLALYERLRHHGARPVSNAATTAAPTPAATRATAGTDALAIALLPLATRLADAEVLQPLADALLDELTAALARRPALAVVAAPMARAAATRAQGDLMRVGELLRVRYLVTGGLRSLAEGHPRLSLNLVCAADAVYLWGLQAELAEADAGGQREEGLAAWAGEIELQACVAAARAAPIAGSADEHPGAKVRQALRTMFERGWSEDAVQESLQIYRDAISADPGHALARAQKAILLALATNMGLRVGAEARSEARADADRALELAPRNSEVLGYAACALADLGEARRAQAWVDRAIQANPGNPQAWAAAGASRLLLGHTVQGIEALERGLRLSPDDFRRPVWMTLLAGACQRLGQLERAAEYARAGCRADARYHPARLALAAVEIERGNDAAARAALREALRIRPQMASAEARGWVRRRWFARLLALWPADALTQD